ncbi:MAG: LptF/LptG family permease [Nitrospirae bacterium]|nr:LptF/LptG family permease [Nitrospirota bacterium]
MLIVQRYYIKEFFKILLLVAAGLSLIFSMMELIDKIDDFLPYRPPLESLLLYVLFSFPRYLLYLLPMAILICSLFVFSQAKKREEITAVRAAGGSIKALLIPFLYAGLFLSLFGFFLNEFIVPEFSKKTQEIKDEITKKGKKFSFREGTVWFRASDGSIVKIGLYLPEKALSKNISIFRISNGQLKERIEAGKAEWKGFQDAEKNKGGVWKLQKVIVYDIISGKVSRLDELELQYDESPGIFTENIQKPENMGIKKLFIYTKKLEEAGFRNLKLTVDLYSKISYPVINFFMILLGASLPMRGRTGGGLVTTAMGIFISLFYWFSHAMSLSMGYAGIVPPLIATWLVPVIFGIISLKLFRGIQE